MQIIPNTSSLVPEPCVATIGFFDGVHKGHQYLIQQVHETAATKGLHTAVLTFPVHPRKVMDAAHRPELLTTFDEKIALLEKTNTDYCLLLDFTPEIAQLTAEEFMRHMLKERFRVKCLIVGYDHRFGHNRSEGFEEYVRYGQQMGMEVIRTAACNETVSIEGETHAISSSLIRRLLHKGEVSQAAHCLGYRYALEGIVTSGRQIGRQLGFPTANLCVSNAEKLIPADGVYAVWVSVNGEKYKGMLNIGQRPTVNNGTDRTIEVHILHFQGDLYGKPMRLTFAERVREERRFNNMEELAAQLRHDAQQVEYLLHV